MKNYTKFEDELEKRGYLTFTNVGVSMYPLLRQNRDLMHIRKNVGRLKKYDAPLYKKNGRYILHRIIEVRENDYVICGDNCTEKEYGITDRDILGVLVGITRDGKYIPVTDKKYLLYVHLWCDFIDVRILILKFFRGVKKLIKSALKIFKIKK